MISDRISIYTDEPFPHIVKKSKVGNEFAAEGDSLDFTLEHPVRIIVSDKETEKRLASYFYIAKQLASIFQGWRSLALQITHSMMERRRQKYY